MKTDHDTIDGRVSEETAAESTAEVEESKPIPRSKRAKSRSAVPESASRTGSSETDTAKAEPADSTGPSDSGPTAGPRQVSITVSARSLWRVLGALVVIAALVAIGWLGWGYYQDRQRLAAFDDAKSASSIFAQKLTGSMNATDVANLKDVVGPLSTGDYRKHLEEQLGDTVKAIESLQVKTTKTEVQQVAVVNFDATHAQTTVTVEVTGTSTMAPQGGTSLFMYSLKLDKQDGKWLVSDVEALQGGLTGSDAAGAQTQTAQTPAAETPAAPAN